MPHRSDRSSSGDGLRPDLFQEIASRLRAVCPDIPDDEFASLVEDVARAARKYDGDASAGLLGHIEPENARNTG
jgi:hypothetical protein